MDFGIGVFHLGRKKIGVVWKNGKGLKTFVLYHYNRVGVGMKNRPYYFACIGAGGLVEAG